MAQRRIICGSSRARQRAGLASLAVFLLLALATACQARSSVDAAQTAIVAAQTVLPGAQATAQAGATLVSSALANAQPIIATLQSVLDGAHVELAMTPDSAPPEAVSAVSVEATDVQGTLGQLDASVRRAAADAALRAATQYYPNATVTLTVKDASGAALVSGTVAPGQSPRVQ